MKPFNHLTILAIETSCDDTCIAILEIRNSQFEIRSNIISSQVKLHARYGGVYPFLAKREHQRNLALVLKQTLLKARLLNSKIKSQKSKLQFKIQKLKKIDLIAVTNGPGLEPCLWTGINFAKELAKKWKMPLIPVNHIEAHILANFIGLNSKLKSQKSKTELPFIEARGKKRTKFSSPIKIQNLFPAICLVVSGGHTQLILMKGIGKYKIIGETRDDAAGECFDKTARILGLGYPGGPTIAAEAAKLKSEILNLKSQIKLPRPMIYQRNYDFSFSGLKTAVLYKVRSMKHKETRKKEFIQKMCAEIQQAAIDVLIHKTLKAAKEFKAKSIILGGGVAANEELRKQFKERIEKEIPYSLFLIPNSRFCTDNAAMVAITAYYQWLRGETKNLEDIEANANLRLK